MTGSDSVASIVIPAHNERSVIEHCLRSLLADSEPDEFEVVVACNGCTDDTAEVARRFLPQERVLEIPNASKTDAINLGEEHLSAFPRLYLDADVLVDAESVRSLAKALADPDVLAAAPQIRMDTTDSTSAVRAYYRIWANMAWAESSVFGSGLYALSEEGRQRFEKFPSVKADDYWINAQFHPSERRRVQGALSIVRSAANLRGLVRRKARVLAYARLIDDDLADAPGRPGPRGAGLLDLARSQPQLIPLVGYYVAVALITNGLAAWKIRRNKLDWVSDR